MSLFESARRRLSYRRNSSSSSSSGAAPSQFPQAVPLPEPVVSTAPPSVPPPPYTLTTEPEHLIPQSSAQVRRAQSFNAPLPPPPAPPSGSSHRRVQSHSNSSSGGGRRERAAQPLAGEWATRAMGSIREGAEDPLEFLRQYDTVFLVDDSGSMAGGLWRQAREALAGVVSLSVQYDEDGVDIYFLNDKREALGTKNVSQVRELFDTVDPRGSTPTGTRLEHLLLTYLDKLETSRAAREQGLPYDEVRPVNIIVITDGPPTDDPESVIVAAARRLDKGNYPLGQLGVQFIQIGSDPEAKEFLEDLDDGLAERYSCRDVVDTVPYSGMLLDEKMITKAMMGAVNRRYDRRKNTS